MENLKNLDLINPIKDFIASGKTFIGICLGFQLLFSGSEEFGSMEGFDLIKGLVKKIDNTTNNIKVPHIGWNRIYPLNKDLSTWHGTILNDITSGEYMYFIHSYFAEPESEEHILSITNYNGFSFCSGIKKNNIYGLQFHPEKSAQKGIQIYNNIYNQIKNNYVKA